MTTSLLVSSLLVSPHAHAQTSPYPPVYAPSSDIIQLKPPASMRGGTTMYTTPPSAAVPAARGKSTASYSGKRSYYPRQKPLAPVKILLAPEPPTHFYEPPTPLPPPAPQMDAMPAPVYTPPPAIAAAPPPPPTEPFSETTDLSSAPTYSAPSAVKDIPPREMRKPVNAAMPSDMPAPQPVIAAAPEPLPSLPAIAAPAAAPEPMPTALPPTTTAEALPWTNDNTTLAEAPPAAFEETVPPSQPVDLPEAIPAPPPNAKVIRAVVVKKADPAPALTSDIPPPMPPSMPQLAPAAAPAEPVKPLLDTSTEATNMVSVPPVIAGTQDGKTEIISSPPVQIIRKVEKIGEQPSEPVAVPTPPPIQEAAITTDTSVPPPPMLVDPSPVASLSAETKAILDRLPSRLDAASTAASAKGGEPVVMDRVNPAVEVFGDQEYVSSEAVGVKIEVKNPPPDVDHELEMAYEALLSGQTEAAIELYQRTLQASPTNTTALFGLATTYHRLGQLDKARPYYGKLLSIDPKHREGLTNFLAMVAEESPEEALVEFERLELKNPNFSPIPAQIALIYQKLGDEEKAAVKMAQAVRLSPDNLIYRYNLAIIMDKLGNKIEAASLYKQLIAAFERGATIPGSVDEIQERLTFIQSN